MGIYNKVSDMNNANKKWCVYMHTNKINNKVYIGITNQKPEVRWCNGNGYRKDQSVFCRAIKKYGWDNFEHIIFAENLTKEEAEVMEMGLIALYKTNCCRYRNPSYGYNMTNGGEGTSGHKHSEEAKEKMRRAATGRKPSSETLRKMSEAHKEQWKDPEYRQKVIAWVQGERNPHYGKHHSEKIKNRIGELNGKPVVQIDINGNFVAEYRSGKLASQLTNISREGIYRCCHHIQQTSGGYKWVYKEEWEEIQGAI